MKAEIHVVYLGLGSNVDAQRNIASGIAALKETLEDVRLSQAYRTRAVGFTGDDFVNLVARCSTVMQPMELKAWLNALENRHGRARDVPKFSDRTLDIDVLLRRGSRTAPRPDSFPAPCPSASGCCRR